MEKWATVLLTICLHGTRAELSLECTPGATIPHTTDCSKYYICDTENVPNLFECPWDQLFNPSTTSCELADNVTCFIIKKEDEETTSVKVTDDIDGEAEQEVKVEQSRHEEEPDLHKQFYLVENGSDEESKMVEPDKVNGSNEDESSQRFDSNSGTSEVVEDEYNVDNSKTDEVIADSPFLGSSEKGLDEKPHEVEESDESNAELSVVSHELFGSERSEEDFDESEEKKINQIKVPTPYFSDTTTSESYLEDDTADDGDQTYILEKREADEKDSNTDIIEPVMEKEPEDGHHDVQDDHHSVEVVNPYVDVTNHDVEDIQHYVEDGYHNYEMERNVSMALDLDTNDTSRTATNSESYNITSVSGVNIMRIGMLTEPIANWTEIIENGWTDLQIFWKHPKDEDFQGSVHFRYPTDSVSDNLEIQHLILEILKLGDETEQPTGSEVQEGTSGLINDKETQTT